MDRKADMGYWIWGCGFAVVLYALLCHLFADSVNFSIWACVAGLVVAVVADKYVPPFRRSLANRERKLTLLAMPFAAAAGDMPDVPFIYDAVMAPLLFFIMFTGARGTNCLKSDERGAMRWALQCYAAFIVLGMFAFFIYEAAIRSDPRAFIIIVALAVGGMIGLVIRFINSKKEKQQ